MAGIAGSNVDFSWLGELPGIAREAQDRTAKRATLADLQSTDPDSLEKKASDLIRRGFLAEGLSLQKAALDRRALTQKGLAEQLQLEWVRNVAPGLRQGAAPAGDSAGDVQIVPQPPGVPTPGRLPSQSPPVAFPPAPGPQGALPMPQQAAEAPPSPTEAILAAAQQGGAPPPVPGQQLAGPPPTPDTAPGLSPATVQGAQLRPAPALPSAVSPPSTGVPPSPIPGQAENQAKLVKVGNTVLTMPPGSQKLPAFQRFMADYRNALAQQKLSPEMESYRIDQIQHFQATGEDLSHSDWKREVQSNPERYKESLKDYGEVKDAGGKAQGMVNTIARMQQISQDPNFVSGGLSGKYGEFVNKLSSLAQIAGVSSWTPQPIIDIIQSKMEPHLKAAALREQFESLANASVLSNAGSLSKGFSEGDRVFTSKMFANVANTPGGIAAINEQLKAIAEHNVALSKVATEYMSDTQKGAKSTPWGLQKAIDKYNAEHPLFVDKNGDLTTLAKKVGASPAQAAPGVITGPDGKTYQSEKEAWDAYRRGGGT